MGSKTTCLIQFRKKNVEAFIQKAMLPHFPACSIYNIANKRQAMKFIFLYKVRVPAFTSYRGQSMIYLSNLVSQQDLENNSFNYTPGSSLCDLAQSQPQVLY